MLPERVYVLPRDADVLLRLVRERTADVLVRPDEDERELTTRLRTDPRLPVAEPRTAEEPRVDPMLRRAPTEERAPVG